MKVGLNPDWDFKEIVDNLRAIRDFYEDILRSFSDFELHNKVLFMRDTRNFVYSYDFEEYKKDKIWEYLNRFECLYVLKGIANRSKQ